MFGKRSLIVEGDGVQGNSILINSLIKQCCWQYLTMEGLDWVLIRLRAKVLLQNIDRSVYRTHIHHCHDESLPRYVTIKVSLSSFQTKKEQAVASKLIWHRWLIRAIQQKSVLWLLNNDEAFSILRETLMRKSKSNQKNCHSSGHSSEDRNSRLYRGLP